MIVAGVDAGSRAIKIVVLDCHKGHVIDAGIADQGVAQDVLSRDLYESVLSRNGLSPEGVKRIVATGYGRNIVGFAHKRITEISCHAAGVARLLPAARTIIEIGGQDSKVIRLGEGGRVRDFNMNDRCAAGTGRFLEVVAARLGVAFDEFGGLASRSREPATISSMCVVFAETEIIGLLAAGTLPDDIAAGVQNSIATRVAAMAGRSIQPPVVLTGGVALIPGMAEALQRATGHEVTIAPDPQLTGALGAALLAC